MNIDFKKLTINDLKKKLINKEISSLNLVQHCIKKIEETHEDLNAIVIKNFENAIEDAKKADENIKNGKIRALEGIPYISKALFCIKGMQTNACSKIIENFIPPYDSTVTLRLKEAGAIVLGAANMDEFAMGGSTTNSFYGPSYNFHKRADGEKVITGGSSGGSATAVAAGLAPFALGSDTGGSVRQPASLCGCVGMKPSFGRVSRFGMIPFASSLDQAGVLANNVEDCAFILNIIAGKDCNDSTCSNRDVPNFVEKINQNLCGIKIGIPEEIDGFQIDVDTKALWKKSKEELEKLGCEIKTISLKNLYLSTSIYYTIAPIEASSNFAKYDGIKFGESVEYKDLKDLNDLYVQNRSIGFGNEVKRRLMLGTFLSSGENLEKYHIHAKKLRNLVYLDFIHAFEKVDAILIPTSPCVARGMNEKSTVLEEYIADLLTIPASLAGMPGISVPVGFSASKLPIGMQIITNRFEEPLLFQIANELHKLHKN